VLEEEVGEMQVYEMKNSEMTSISISTVMQWIIKRMLRDSDAPGFIIDIVPNIKVTKLLQIWSWTRARRLYILCWRELSRCRLLPAVSPAAGHLKVTTPLWQGCQVCVKISAQPPPKVAQFNTCIVHIGLLALSGQE